MAATELEDVTKEFGTAKAVDKLSLVISEGSLHGFIGPNGSGKTTTIRMMAGILRPDSGSVSIFGHTHKFVCRRDLGYLPEERGIYKKMRTRSLLRFHADLSGRRGAREEIDRWLARLDLLHVAEVPVESLSKGMTQRIQFIAAVIGRPRLLILDEPFTGLDPISAELLRSSILDLRRQGATIVLSTHDMNVAEQMCDRIVMIFKGRKVLDGTLSEVRAGFSSDIVSISGTNIAAHLPGSDYIESVRDFGGGVELRIRGW